MKYLIIITLFASCSASRIEPGSQYGIYHTTYGQIAPIYYDTAKGRAYYYRAGNTKFFFGKKATGNIMQGKLTVKK